MANFDDVSFTQMTYTEGSAPSTPTTGDWKVYFKTDGLYVIDDTGTEIGPLTDASSGGGTASGARVRKSTNTSVATSTNVTLSFDTEDTDTDAYHDTGTNPERLTIPSGLGGKFLIGAQVAFSQETSHTDYAQYLVIRVDGSTEIAWALASVALATTPGFSVQTFYELTAGQYVEVFVRQTSGETLNVVSQGENSPVFWISRVGD